MPRPLKIIEQNTPLIDIATRNVVTLEATDSIGKAALIMAEKRISSLVVTDKNGHPLGIVTERDMLHAMQSRCQPETDLQKVMSFPVIAVHESMTCMSAYHICLRDGIRHLVIIDDNEMLVGVVSETDFRLHINLSTLAGRRQIASVMSRSVFKLHQQASLQEALNVMRMHHDTCVVVVDAERPLGIITERDIVRLYSSFPEKLAIPVNQVMTSPALTISQENTINEAAEQMLSAKVRHLVVVDHAGLITGLLSEHDLTHAMTMGLVSDKLIEEGAFLHTLVNTIPDLIWLKDLNGVYMACNPRFERFFGAKEKDIVGKTDYDFMDKDLVDFFREHDRKAMEKGEPTVNEEWITYADDGHRELLETTKTPMHDSQGKLIGVLGIGHDITKRKQAEESQHIIASVFGNSQEAIIITNAENLITDVNPAFTHITGYSREEVLGLNPKLLSSGRQDKEFYGTMWQSLNQNKAWRGEMWNRRKSGEVYAELLAISVICDNDGNALRYVGVFSDISYLKEHEAELSRVANYDPLTGMPNRRLLADRLRQAIARAQRNDRMIAVCYIDLDGFKLVNDHYGHEVGDQLLISITQRLQESLRAGDTLARLGGDEFVVVFNDLVREQECLQVLDRILSIVAMPIIINKHEIVVSASIGVTFYPSNDEDGDTLLRNADQAMYVAKQTGKNRYHLYDSKQDQRVRSLYESRRHILKGLENGEFELYYQPKIELITGNVVGVEALIRWHHTERGLLLPAEFLPFIEDSDLEIKLGEWVMDTAMAQLEVWGKEDVALEISINISARHLQSPNFVSTLANKLAKHPNLLRDKLQIEVLETAALEDIVQSSDTINACRKMGINFALDDFGTGYSSLAYLRKLSAETLKIDQTFVRGMLTDEGDRAIVQGIIALAKTFGRKTVAEGMEAAELTQLLIDFGCMYGQGYGIARPMTGQDFVKWRKERK